MMVSGSLDVKPLISHEFDILKLLKHMNLLANSSLGILINYPGIDVNLNSKVSLSSFDNNKFKSDKILKVQE